MFRDPVRFQLIYNNMMNWNKFLFDDQLMILTRELSQVMFNPLHYHSHLLNWFHLKQAKKCFVFLRIYLHFTALPYLEENIQEKEFPD